MLNIKCKIKKTGEPVAIVQFISYQYAVCVDSKKNFLVRPLSYFFDVELPFASKPELADHPRPVKKRGGFPRRFDRNGRISLPAEYRKALGIGLGETAEISMEGSKIIIEKAYED